MEAFIGAAVYTERLPPANAAFGAAGIGVFCQALSAAFAVIFVLSAAVVTKSITELFEAGNADVPSAGTAILAVDILAYTEIVVAGLAEPAVIAEILILAGVEAMGISTMEFKCAASELK